MTAQVSPDSSQHMRRLMVDGQIRTYDVTNRELVDQFYKIAREDFVEPEQVGLAYSDFGLVAKGTPPRPLLMPMLVARMIQNADLRTSDRVLDLAGGLGYSAAIMAGLCREVIALECDARRTEFAQAALTSLAITNVICRNGPIAAGAPTDAPFDVILLNGAYRANLDALLLQLAPEGRLLAVRADAQAVTGQVVRWQKSGDLFGTRALFSARAAVVEGFEAKPVFAF